MAREPSQLSRALFGLVSAHSRPTAPSLRSSTWERARSLVAFARSDLPVRPSTNRRASAASHGWSALCASASGRRGEEGRERRGRNSRRERERGLKTSAAATLCRHWASSVASAPAPCNGHVNFVKHLLYILGIIGSYVFNVKRLCEKNRAKEARSGENKKKTCGLWKKRPSSTNCLLSLKWTVRNHVFTKVELLRFRIFGLAAFFQFCRQKGKQFWKNQLNNNKVSN